MCDLLFKVRDLRRDLLESFFKYFSAVMFNMNTEQRWKWKSEQKNMRLLWKLFQTQGCCQLQDQALQRIHLVNGKHNDDDDDKDGDEWWCYWWGGKPESLNRW